MDENVGLHKLLESLGLAGGGALILKLFDALFGKYKERADHDTEFRRDLMAQNAELHEQLQKERAQHLEERGLLRQEISALKEANERLLKEIIKLKEDSLKLYRKIAKLEGQLEQTPEEPS